MKQLFKNLTLLAGTALISLIFVLGISGRQVVWADAKGDACQGVGLVTGNGNAGCGSADNSTNGVNSLITMIVNILSVIVGIVAVIMIIIGGFRFVTSGGDSNNTNSARNSIIYAIVGLVIVAVAQIVVKYVLNRVPSG
ncbi:MAG: hypothetical protein ACXWLH_02260 [Candidatus Saccharimonadales bacterium]